MICSTINKSGFNIFASETNIEEHFKSQKNFAFIFCRGQNIIYVTEMARLKRTVDYRVANLVHLLSVRVSLNAFFTMDHRHLINSVCGQAICDISKCINDLQLIEVVCYSLVN